MLDLNVSLFEYFPTFHSEDVDRSDSSRPDLIAANSVPALAAASPLTPATAQNDTPPPVTPKPAMSPPPLISAPPTSKLLANQRMSPRPPLMSIDERLAERRASLPVIGEPRMIERRESTGVKFSVGDEADSPKPSPKPAPPGATICKYACMFDIVGK